MIAVERAYGRNDNTIVRYEDGRRYFLKRAYAADSSARHLLNYEAAFCRFCNERDTDRQLDGLVPRLSSSNPEAGEFAYDLLEGATPLWNVYSRSPDEATGVAFEFGKRLAHLHLRCSALVNEESRSWIASGIPSAFTLHKPAPADLSVLSATTHKLLSIVQQRFTICQRLDDVRARWEDTAVLHGDIRSGNVLVRFEGNFKGRPVVHFVDFETAQFGDPAWDVAGALQDVVLFWLYSMTPNANVELMIASANRTLSGIQTIARNFLHGYVSEYRLDLRDSQRFIDRAVQFSAVRMLQSAYEAAADADDLPAPAVLLLQLAENVLSDPQSAARSFYGVAF